MRGKRLFTLVIAGCGAFGCSESPTSSKEPNVVLQVQRSEGVDGSPQAGELSVTKGTSVPYGFSTQATHSDLIVSIDGKQVPQTGTILLDATKTLVATAVRKPVVPPEDASLVTSANTILTSNDAVDAFNQHLLGILDLYRRVREPEARARLSELERQAAATNTSTEARQRAVHTALGGHTFWINGPTPGASSSAPYASSGIADNPVTFLYVNGILTMPGKAAEDAEVLKDLIVAPSGNSQDKVGLFYNVSWLYNGTNTTARCLLPLQDQLGSDNTPLVYAQMLGKCLLANLVDVLDIRELLRQLNDVSLGFKAEAEPDAKLLGAAILQEINQGRRVIVVAHSQGNLMTQQALNLIKQSALPGLNPLPCIGVLRYAPPSSSNWTVENNNYLNGFVIEGDITRLLMQNSDMVPLTTTRSTNFLKLGDVAAALGGLIGGLFKELVVPYLIHYVREGYMVDADARNASIAQIQSLRAAVTSGDGCTGAFKVIIASSGQNDGGGPSDLFLVSPASDGQDQPIAQLKTLSGASPPITDLAWCPGGLLYAISYFDLYSVNFSTAVLTPIAAHGRSGANALTCAPNGDLYMGAGTTLYRFSADRLSNVQIGSTTQGTYSGDLAFNKTGALFATMRISGEPSDVLVQVDPLTGKTSRIGTIGFSNVWGVTFVADVLYGLTTSTSGVGSLILINTTTGEGTKVRSLTFDAFGSTIRATKADQP